MCCHGLENISSPVSVNFLKLHVIVKDCAVGGMTLVLSELEVSDYVVAAVSEPVAGKMRISVGLSVIIDTAFFVLKDTKA